MHNFATCLTAATLALMLPVQSPAEAATKAAAPPPAAAPATPAAPALQVPPGEALIMLIRTSLIALNQANLTNNYSVLNALGSANFRAANSAPQLAQTFATFRTNKIDLSPVAFVQPQLSAQPSIANGQLHLVGFFPTRPMQVNYDLTFDAEQGAWKLFGLGVNLNRPAAPPAAPATPAPASATPAKPAPAAPPAPPKK